MQYYDRSDVSGGIDVKKIIKSKGYIICHYWYFLDMKDLNFNHISAMGVMNF